MRFRKISYGSVLICWVSVFDEGYNSPEYATGAPMVAPGMGSSSCTEADKISLIVTVY
jgi:hypothetical protein